MKNEMKYLAALIICALPVALSSQVAPSAKGAGYTMVMTTDSAGKKTTMTMGLETLGSKFRMDMKSDAMPGAAMEVSTIIDSLEGTMTNVMKAQSMAMIMPMSMIKQQALTAPPYTLELAGTPALETKDLGAGEKMLGHATHHSRQTMTYSMKFTMGDVTCLKPSREVADVWTTDEISLPDLTDAIQRFTGAGKQGAFAQTLDSIKKKSVKGTTLKRVGVSSTVGAAGDTLRITNTMEMAALKSDSVSPADFDVPPGMNVMDMREQMKNMDMGMMQEAVFSAQLKMADRIKQQFCGTAGAKP